MKRLLSVCLLMSCLCLPVFAGHNVIGGWCECSTPGCICEPDENRATAPKESEPRDLGPEVLLVFAVLLLALRYKA